MKKRCLFGAIAIVALLCSCGAVLRGALDELTTNHATYKDEAGGIEITLADKSSGLPQFIGFVSKEGKIVKRAKFILEDKGDTKIFHGVEIPVDYVKVSDEPKFRAKRSTAPARPSKYKGTWLGFFPSYDGMFKRVFLDFDEEGKVDVYMETRAADDGEASRIVTDVDTEIKGRLKKTVNESSQDNGYQIGRDMNLQYELTKKQGYYSSFPHIIDRLEKKEKDGKKILVANFKTFGGGEDKPAEVQEVEMFEFNVKIGSVDRYVGYGDFAKDKAGKEVTLEIDDSNLNFTLTVFKGTNIPRVYKKK